IDVYDYLTNGSNAGELRYYFSSNGANYTGTEYYMYTGAAGYGGGTAGSVSAHPGLFSGYYVEPETGEVKEIGNDNIKTVRLMGVEELPDYCFESCENLEYVDLHDDSSLEDIGALPFKSCDKLKHVSFHDTSNYSELEQIIYEKNGEDDYTVVECLGSRGNGEEGVSSPAVSASESELWPKVTEIAEGAFSDCDNLGTVNLSTASKLTAIPKDCFNGCDYLSSVTLPESVNIIRAGAFAGTDNNGKNIGLDVTIPAKEVQIDDGAFNGGLVSLIRTSADSSAARYANTHQVRLDVENNYKVVYLDYDGSIFKSFTVKEGDSLPTPADIPRRDGFTFAMWQPVGSGSISDGVTQDLEFIAIYTINPIQPTGKSGSTVTKSGSKSSDKSNSSSSKYRVIVEYGSGDGEYEKDSTVSIYANDAPSGNTFDRWVIISGLGSLDNAENRFTTFKMPTHEVRVRATYKKDGSTSGNGSRSSTTSDDSSSRSSGSSSSSRSTTGGSSRNTGRTSVVLNSTGITNSDLANAVVHGSTDNFVVRITQDDATTGQVEEALRAQYGSLENLLYYPMNIQLFNESGTVQITDTSGLTVDVTVPLPDALRSYGGNNHVAAIRAGALESLSPRFSSISGTPCVTFTASHFSPYVIWTDTAHLSDGLMDANPKTGDIEPKWFLSAGLASTSLLLFFKKDRRKKRKA
ncbi:MAG: leucine-rich repeat domain-containing protein, partial [Lachnospiraceae bacterium]|nr:leucine-rich repeat domain-containing protein [Lachnospiraceae bacterium]